MLDVNKVSTACRKYHRFTAPNYLQLRTTTRWPSTAKKDYKVNASPVQDGSAPKELRLEDKQGFTLSFFPSPTIP